MSEAHVRSQADRKIGDMTPGEKRLIIETAPLYKMSLGKAARFRAEALQHNVLVFSSETSFYDAVVRDDDTEIIRRGKLLRSDVYPHANAPDNTIRVWQRSIHTIRDLPSQSVVLHWEADQDSIYWAISGSQFYFVREDVDEFSAKDSVFYRELMTPWSKSSLGGVPLSNIHPKARDYAINMATINKIQTHDEYFRALFTDRSVLYWEQLPDWKTKVADKSWYPKNRSVILEARRAERITPTVEEIADHFDAEFRRMAATAMATAAYANGQTKTVVVKEKSCDFTREQLEEEIAALMKIQEHRCALTNYTFKHPQLNAHLRPSLDRIDSSKGYVPGNLQIVTRAANFYKSASDEVDWLMKANALEHMAAALQAKKKSDREREE